MLKHKRATSVRNGNINPGGKNNPECEKPLITPGIAPWTPLFLHPFHCWDLLFRVWKRCHFCSVLQVLGLFCCGVENHRSPPVLFSEPGIINFTHPGGDLRDTLCAAWSTTVNPARVPAVGPGMCTFSTFLTFRVHWCASFPPTIGWPEGRTTMRRSSHT